MQKIAMYIDGSHWYYMQKNHLRWWIDPKNIYDWISNKGELVEAVYYSIVDSTNPAQISFVKALSNIGYQLKLKYEKEISTSVNNSMTLTSIVFDMMNNKYNFDKLYLISGNKVLCPAVESLVKRGKQVVVLSTDKIVSRQLINIQGVEYQNVADLRTLLERF